MVRDLAFLFSRQKIRQVVDFLGRGIVGLWIAGIFISLFSFFAEVAFTFSLQSLLALIGGKAPVPIGPVTFTSSLSIKSALGFLILTMLVRIVVQWTLSINGRAISYKFALNQRLRIIRWIFKSRSVNSADAHSFFSEKVVKASESLEVMQSLFTNALVASLLFCILLVISKRLVVVGLICVFVLAVIHRWAGRRLIVYSRRIQSHSFDALKSLDQSIRNLLLIRIHHLQQKHSDIALNSLQNIYSNSVRANWTSSTALFLGQVSAGVAAIVLIFFAKFETYVSVQKVAVFMYLFFRFSQRTSAATAAVSEWMMKRPFIQQLFHWYRDQYAKSEIISLEQESKTEQGLVRLSQPLGWRFSNVEFSYPAHRAIFSSLNLLIEPGTIASISGPSGIGKTTLVYLLLGQVAPTGGHIEVSVEGNWVGLNVVQHKVLQNVGYAGPEPYLIAGTIRENLDFGLDQPALNSYFHKMVEIAECEFIEELNLGLDHKIGEQGDGLSAGQKQRICLLRALLRNPRVLILDEATSHVDFQTELKILQNLKKLSAQCTIILISHRQQVQDCANYRIDLEEMLIR